MFQLPDEANLYIIEGEYSIAIVLLSVVIAFGASYTALFINKQIQSNSFFHQIIWLTLASFAMGLGIWSMHFIGMSAFQLPIAMQHNTWLTIVSAIPAILASYIAFYLANQKKQRLFTLLIASILMGTGISTMHYLGMAAMEIDASYIYKLTPFVISIVISIMASFAALVIFSYGTKITDKMLIKLAAALLMAIAISSMHYMGMFAIQFYSFSPIEQLHGVHIHSTDFTPTVIIISIGITSLFILTYLTSRLDGYVNFRIKNFDPLTSLPNQNQFMKDQKVNRYSTFVSIIHIHNFEKFISAYGYTFCDKILLQIKALIVNSLPHDTKIYRTEANRFTVVALETNHQDIRIALNKICSVLSKPMIIKERFLTIEIVCGVSSSKTKEKVHDHFANAIAVLQASSTTFEHQIIDYNPDFHTYNFERQVRVDLKRAMDEHQLYIVYQPKVNPVTETVVGLEALIRWNHPEYGFISPGQFIPILENTNQIEHLTNWIIEQACQQMERWNKDGLIFHQVSINIPGSYVTSPNLTNHLNECLHRYKVPASQMELEITETSVINDIQNAISAVSDFRMKGFNVALDDFGTGLSSLSYLKEIPITTIKIDKSFVDGVQNSKKDSAILGAILNLCYSLDLNVVIEGVETKEQVEYLLSQPTVPIVQGYYYSKPLTVEDLEVWLKKISLATMN